MELKPKYQYTYFIKPFIIKGSYTTFLRRMLENENLRLKTWEKEADADVYSYFLPNIRSKMFFGFDYSRTEVEELRKKNTQKKLRKLSKYPCLQFNYILNENASGKIGMKDGIFFDIGKINIVCFNSGLCFIIIKTYLEDIQEFSNILNFNYKFRELMSEEYKLKKFEKINIQTSNFSSIFSLKTLILNITGKYENTLIEDDKFYVYSYTCIDGENWNDKITFEDIKIEYWKYANVCPSGYNVDINLKNQIQPISNWQYARFGFNKNACVLFTSSLNPYNYTKLPHEFENQYLYTYLIALYQKLYFKKLTKEFKTGKRVLKTRYNLNSFIKYFWHKEITKDEIGSSFYGRWLQIYETENLYLETMNMYDLALKENKRKKTDYSLKIIVILLLLCVILNIAELIQVLH